MGVWDLLGIEPTNDIKEIKKAYAKQAKIYHPEENPEFFLSLHNALKSAIDYAKGLDIMEDYNKGNSQAFAHGIEYQQQKESLDVSIKFRDNTSDRYKEIFQQSFELYEQNIKNDILDMIEQFSDIVQQIELDKSDEIDEIYLINKYLSSDSFIKYKSHPFLISQLEEFLKQHNNLSLNIYVQLYYAYDFYKIEEQENKEKYEVLFSILYPSYKDYLALLDSHKIDLRKFAIVALVVILSVFIFPVFLIITIILIVRAGLVLNRIYKNPKEHPDKKMTVRLIIICSMMIIFLFYISLMLFIG